MNRDEFDEFMRERRYEGRTDHQLEAMARVVWNNYRETGRWVQPEATQIAAEMLRRGWVDLPQRKITVTP